MLLKSFPSHLLFKTPIKSWTKRNSIKYFQTTCCLEIQVRCSQWNFTSLQTSNNKQHKTRYFEILQCTLLSNFQQQWSPAALVKCPSPSSFFLEVQKVTSAVCKTLNNKKKYRRFWSLPRSSDLWQIYQQLPSEKSLDSHFRLIFWMSKEAHHVS